MRLQLTDIQTAAQRIAPHIRHTPLFQVSQVRQAPASAHKSLSFKLDNLQVSGSFKARGAVNMALALPEGVPAAGIVAASGGNHGVAVAYVGHTLNVPTRVYLADNAPPDKAQKIRAWGAQVVQEGKVFDESSAAAQRAATESGAVYFHPFGHEHIIAGQGTLALELFEDAPQIDVVVVAVGGGGLISGVGVVAQAFGARVIGVEPSGAPTHYESRRAAQIVTLPTVSTRVGTLAPLRTEPINYEHVQALVDDLVLVNDDEILEGARWLWREFGIAADMAGAAGAAAMLYGRVATQPHERVCVVVCGAGADGILA